MKTRNLYQKLVQLKLNNIHKVTGGGKVTGQGTSEGLSGPKGGGDA